MDQLGLVESLDKACWPVTQMVFLVVLFNTEAGTLEVSKDRLVEIMVLLDDWWGKQTASKRGRDHIFISRLLEFLRNMGNSDMLTPQFRKDLGRWRTLCHFTMGCQ